MPAQTVLTCPACQAKFAIAAELKPPAKVKCPTCAVILNVPSPASPAQPAAAPTNSGPSLQGLGQRLPVALIPVCAIYVSLLSLVLLIFLKQHVLGLLLGLLAALGSVAGLILSIRKGEKGLVSHFVAIPACVAAVLLGINSFGLKSSLERNEELVGKNDKAAAQAKADLEEAKKKWAEVEEGPRKAAEMLKKAEEAPRKAEELFAKAKEAQQIAQEAEKKAVALAAKNEAAEKDIAAKQKQAAEDRKKAEDAQVNVERLHKQIAAKTMQVADLQSKIEEDRQKADERNKETQELLKKVEEAVGGVVGNLKNKEAAERVKATKTLAKFAAYRPPLPGDTVKTLCDMVATDPVAEAKSEALNVLEKLTPDLYPHIKVLTRPADNAAPPYASYASASASLGQLGKKARAASPIILNQLAASLKMLAKEVADMAVPNKALVDSIKNHLGALADMAPDDPGTIGAVGNVASFSNDADFGWLRLLSYKALASSAAGNANTTKLVLPFLVKGLSDKDDGARLYIIPLLEKMGPQAAAAVPALRELRFNPNAKIGEAATQALKVLDKGG